MALDEEQRREIVEWYELYVKKCPLCDCEEYLLEAMVGMPELLASGPNPKGGLPVVPIVCKNCGYTILISATAMKFYKPMRPPT